MRHLQADLEIELRRHDHKVACLKDMMQVDWKKVPRDTVVYVGDDIGNLSQAVAENSATPYHLACVTQDAFKVYAGGKSSRTANNCIVPYRYCVLADK